MNQALEKELTGPDPLPEAAQVVGETPGGLQLLDAHSIVRKMVKREIFPRQTVSWGIRIECDTRRNK